MVPSKDRIPKSGEFLDGRLWFQRRGTLVTVGVTSLGVEEVGAVQSIEFPDEGEDFSKGDTVVTIEGTGGSIEVMAPASGVVEEINSAAESDPDRVSDDPMEEGWLVKLEIEDLSDLTEFSAVAVEEDEVEEDEDEDEEEDEDDESEEE